MIAKGRLKGVFNIIALTCSVVRVVAVKLADETECCGAAPVSDPVVLDPEASFAAVDVKVSGHVGRVIDKVCPVRPF